MPAGLLRRAIPVIVAAVVTALIVALGLAGDGTSTSTTTESGPGDAAARESIPDKTRDTKSTAGSAGKRASSSPTTGSNEPDGRAFETLDDFDPADAGDQAGVRPRKAEAFRINRDALATELARAPSAKAAKQGAPLSTISVPDPDGGTAKFRIQETSVMEPGLAARHPEIKTYAGLGVTDPTATIRLDLTPLGFHASVREAAGARAWYVDPAFNEPGTTLHLSYDRDDLPAPQQPFREGDLVEAAAAFEPEAASLAPGDQVHLRTYGLALVNDATYAQDFGGNANVVAAKSALVNRVNQIYNEDLAIHLELVENTAVLNLSGNKATKPNGPCGANPCYTSSQLAGCSPDTLDRNPFVLNQLVGAENYDLGHLVLGKNGGGIAGIGVVGGSRKAEGCTGLPTPTGDFFAVDYVAHEIGHQFDANHTFNGTQLNCSGFNRNQGTSVEPGSGSSVMGYAGICDRDDLQPHSDPYFSQESIEEITAFVTSAPRGADVTATDNHSPVVGVDADRDGEPDVDADRTIPQRTPFTLTATGTDEDVDDELVYLWEQNDQGVGGGRALLTNAKPNGPLFRVFGTAAHVTEDGALETPSPGQNQADGSPSRTFPDLAQILAGNTNAKTGSCPVPPPSGTLPKQTVDCYSEFLPTTAYAGPGEGGELNFRVTARDVDPLGGTSHADVTLTIDEGTGPFLVTSRGTAGEAATAGEQETLEWSEDTAHLSENVRISLSTDGGVSWDVLVPETLNDGSEEVTWPDVATTQARIKVEAVENYFFDVNDADFMITSVTFDEPTPATATAPFSDQLAEPITLVASSPLVDGDELSVDVSGVDGLEGVRVSSTPVDGETPGTATFTINGPVQALPGTHQAKVTVTEPGQAEATTTFPVEVSPEDATVEWAGPIEPVESQEASTSVLLSTTVTDDPDADPGDVNLAEVTFVDRNNGNAELCTASVIGGPITGTATCEAALAAPAEPTETLEHTVGTVVDGAYFRDDAGDDEPVVIERVEDDTLPETVITSGPPANSFVLAPDVTIGYRSTDPGQASFSCLFDQRSVPCGTESRTWPGFAPGPHVFSVTATDDEANNTDPSPATRRFVSPYNDGQMKRRGAWQRKRSGSAYRGDYLRASSSGATLSMRVKGVKKIALVVGTAPSYGKVTVNFKGQRIGTVNLRSSHVRGRVLKSVASFPSARSGWIKIRTTSGRTVRIEGLGAG